MSKVFASKGPRGISARYAPDNEIPGPGEVEVEVQGDMGPAFEGMIWDDALGAPRESTAAEKLAEAQREQEQLVRDAANSEYLQKVRAFEGAVIAAKWAKGLALNATEQQVFDGMNTNYNRLTSLVTQIRAASTIEAVKQINW